MLEHAKLKSEFKLYPVSKEEALKVYANNPFKTELIENLEDGSITFCTHENFTDLCRGGHIPHTGLVKAVKILNAAGAYWRGNEKILSLLVFMEFRSQNKRTKRIFRKSGRS